MRIIQLSILVLLFSVLFSACGEDDPVTPQDNHFEAIGVALYRGDVLHASILRGETNDTLRAAVGVTGEDYDVRFYNEDEHIVEAHDDEVTFSWEIGDTSVVEVVQESGKEGKFEFRLRGLKAGSTVIEFFILHEGHSDFRSGKMPLVVE